MNSHFLGARSKPVLALVMAVAIVLAGFAAVASAAARRKPALTIGTKNFTEQYVLGELYKQALEAKGYKVTLKEDIGSSELIDTAFKSGKINFYPEYTGVLVADIAKQPLPKTAPATWAAAKRSSPPSATPGCSR